MTTLHHLRVFGDLACFTRPEMKVERVSYKLNERVILFDEQEVVSLVEKALVR